MTEIKKTYNNPPSGLIKAVLVYVKTLTGECIRKH